MLFVDQLEELFTLVTADRRAAFIALLAHAAGDPRLRVLATLRADFLPQCATEPKLVELLQAPAGSFPLWPPDGLALEEMIRQPAARVGLGLEDDLVREILTNAGTEPGALPLVAFCLEELYRRRGSVHRLSVAAYEALGRLHGAIARRADAILQELRQAEGEAIAARLPAVFQALVHLEAAGPTAGTATRRRAFRDNLDRDPLTARLLEALIAGRLLATGNAEGRATVEVAHEAMFEGWPEFRDWLDQNRADLMLCAELAADAARWQHAGRDDGFLLPKGKRLDQAAALVKRRPELLDPQMTPFLQASRERVQREDDRRRRESLNRATLSRFAVWAQRSSCDQDTIMRLFLTGVTSEQGLGLSRAMLFLKNDEGNALTGAMAIGDLEHIKAKQRWEELSNERENIEKTGKDDLDVLETYFQRADKLSAAIKNDFAEDAPLSQAIKKHTQRLETYGRAVADCLKERRCQVVRYDEDDQFRNVFATISDGSDRGAAFICVPVAFRDRVLGVMVADNRFLPWERQSDFDESALHTYADILAISLENERLRKTAVVYQVYSEIGHDLSTQLSALSSLISCLEYEIRAPYIEEIFWNVSRGDYFRRMVEIKDDLKRFAKDLRTVGSPVLPSYMRIHLNTLINDCISRFKMDWLAREHDHGMAVVHDTRGNDRDEDIHIEHILDYTPCDEDVTVDVDMFYMWRVFRALLDNAMWGVSGVLRPHIIVATTIEADPGNGPFVSVSISDNGKGVPGELKEKIFAPFFTTRPREIGAGLGLTNARRFVEAHGGTLREAGEYGKGAVFLLRLPLSGTERAGGGRENEGFP